MLAANQGKSLSGFLEEQLQKLVHAEFADPIVSDLAYQQAKVRALARMASGYNLGGEPLPSREDLHDRRGGL